MQYSFLRFAIKYHHRFFRNHFHKDAQICKTQIWAKLVFELFSMLKVKPKTGGIHYGKKISKFPVQMQKISHIKNRAPHEELSSGT